MIFNNRFFRRRKRLKSRFIYNQNDINKVVFNLDLVDILSDFISLRKKGNNFVSRCPFCREITENDYHFVVSRKKSLYKCFECGTGGTSIISFLMKYYNAPFDKIIYFLDKKYTKIGIKPERIRVVKKNSNIDDDLPF